MAKLGKNLKIAVLDLGAGTFDVTILDINNGLFHVLSTSGDVHLGGKDINVEILDYLVEEIEEKYGICLENDKRRLSKLRDAGEMAKIHLSTEVSTSIDTGVKAKCSGANLT